MVLHVIWESAWWQLEWSVLFATEVANFRRSVNTVVADFASQNLNSEVYTVIHTVGPSCTGEDAREATDADEVLQDQEVEERPEDTEEPAAQSDRLDDLEPFQGSPVDELECSSESPSPRSPGDSVGKLVTCCPQAFGLFASGCLEFLFNSQIPWGMFEDVYSESLVNLFHVLVLTGTVTVILRI